MVNKTSLGAVLSSFGYQYDISSRRTKITRVLGTTPTVTEYGYSKAGWLTRETRKKTNGDLIWEDQYAYDFVGNRTSKVHTAPGSSTKTTNYWYNGGHQLVRESGATMTVPATLMTTLIGETTDEGSGIASVRIEDENGTTIVGSIFTEMLALPVTERRDFTVIATDNVGNVGNTYISVYMAEPTKMLITVRGPYGEENIEVGIDVQATVTYNYDKNGNLTQRSQEGQNTTFEWDHENRLTRIVHPDGRETKYEYCAGCSLRLLSKKTRMDGSTVEYKWDGANTVEEVDSGSGYVTEYFVNPNSMLGNVMGVKKGDDWYYPIYDAMGTVWQVVDSTGGVKETRNYDAWGNELNGLLNSSSPLLPSLGWQSKPWDEEGGIYYSRARWYDPRVGRFTSTDRREGSGHLYCGADPVNFSDANGLFRVAFAPGVTEDQRRLAQNVIDRLYVLMKKNPCLMEYLVSHYGQNPLGYFCSGCGPKLLFYYDANPVRNGRGVETGYYDPWLNQMEINLWRGNPDMNPSIAHNPRAEVGGQTSNYYSDIDLLGMSLIHEMEHYMNDVSDPLGNLNPDISSELSSMGLTTRNYESGPTPHGPYGYVPEYIRFS